MELEIIRVMMQSPGIQFSYKVIGKMVSRTQFRRNPHWARPILEKLVFEHQLVKEDVYYVYPTDQQKAELREAQRRRNVRTSPTGTAGESPPGFNIEVKEEE